MMDLRNNQITIRELLENPASRDVLSRRFPHVIHRPIVTSSGSMTLERAAKLGAAYVPLQFIRETIRELQAL